MKHALRSDWTLPLIPLICWFTSSVTIPLGFTRTLTWRVTPVFCEEILLTTVVLPPEGMVVEPVETGDVQRVEHLDPGDAQRVSAESQGQVRRGLATAGKVVVGIVALAVSLGFTAASLLLF